MNDGSLLTTNGGVQGASIDFLPPIEAIERIEIIRQGPGLHLYMVLMLWVELLILLQKNIQINQLQV